MISLESLLILAALPSLTRQGIFIIEVLPRVSGGCEMFRGRCFVFHSQARPWREAKRVCSERPKDRSDMTGGRLARVTDDGDKEFLYRMIYDRQQPSAWLSGRWSDQYEGFTRYFQWSNHSHHLDDVFYLR